MREENRNVSPLSLREGPGEGASQFQTVSQQGETVTPPLLTSPSREGELSEPNSSTPAKIPATFYLLAVLAVILDQATKYWIKSTLPFGAEMPVLPGWMHFTHTLNHGAAWGVLSGQRWLLIVVSVVVIGFILMLAREVSERGKVAAGALGLILGGAIGNLIDRVLHGAVTDFIDLDTPFYYLQTFPVFNVADSALTVGVTLLIVQWLFAQFFTAEGAESAEDL